MAADLRVTFRSAAAITAVTERNCTLTVNDGC